MTTPVLLANTDLVAVAWLASVPGFNTSMVATSLPTPTSKWETTGFVTVRASGGADNVYYPLRGPVVTVDCWAVKTGSQKPPWGQAFSLAEQIVANTYNTAAPMRQVALPTGYPAARVDAAWVLQPPRRSYADPGNFAHVVMDLQLKWISL